MSDFVHLHVHSEYSLLDGHSRTKAVAARAQELGMPAVAVTDHGTMFAAIEFHDACKDKGVKPIIGVESYIAPRTMADRDGKIDRSNYHLVLLAENETGYKNLLKLSSTAQLEGFYQKPRVDKAYLEGVAEGLIATTGCLAAEIPQLISQGKSKQARDLVDWYRQVFQDRFYIELQEHGIPELSRVNKELIALAREFNLKLIATNDVHYVAKEDWFAQDVLLCVQTGATINSTDRMKMDGRDYWFKSAEEMREVWREIPEALTNTLEIAERCNVDLSFKGYHLPNFPVPDGYTAENYLRLICENGFRQRYPDPIPAQIDRLNYELGVIHKMGFDTYFLIVWDLTTHAREHGIWANARGSAAGSIVAYSLGITHLDPLEHNLIFERFLNPDRISMPDIDLDFPDDAREHMIRYTVDKYGKANVAQIITFGKMLAKAAIRDVGRAMDYPLSETDRVAKLIPVGPGQTIENSLENVRELRELYESSDYIKKLIDNAKLVEGITRNASTHAAGVVVTDKPVIEYTPLHRPTRGDESGTPVTQYPMGDIEHIGLLKIDFLGLAHLTIVREACGLINARHGTNYDLNSIPVEDDEAFKLLSRGDVIGVFQVEGCLSADTRIGHRTIKQVYQAHLEQARRGLDLWMHRLKTDSCYLDEGILTQNEIQQVVFSGIKPVYRLLNEYGYWIKATADHQFLTERGWVRLGDLDPTTDRLLFKPTASRVGRLCARCGKPLKSVSKRVSHCKVCSSTLSANPSRPEVQARISQSKLGSVPWNRGLNAENAADTTWIQKLRAYGESQRGISMTERLGKEKAAAVKAKMSKRFSGKGNPMYGRPPKWTKTYAKDGYRPDLGHYVRSSWEADLARVFRYSGLDYQYEPRTFELVASDGNTLTYTPDFFVPTLNQWFEVKGWMDSVSATKLELFRQQYPECELVIVDKTRFAEFQLEYSDLVEWECPQIPPQTEWVKIARIESLGEEETFDLRMRAPGNNFIANGFVVHNSGMKRVLTQLKPSKFDHIVATIALYRPGPMDYIPTYIARLHGQEKVEYHHPSLEPILSETFGIMVYQEQIMRIARDLCGFTGGETDTLRKAVGKKNKEAILKQREKFITGAGKTGILTEEIAAKIFDDIEFFARYGFNKAHAAVYGVLTGQTAYLKAHYTIEYMTALLSTDIGNTDKIAMFIAEARHLGIQILPPDVRYSGIKYTIDDTVESGGAIRAGMLTIKNVGEGPLQAILQARGDQPFTSLDDFCTRVDLKQVNRRVLESLIKAGAFDGFGHRAQLLEAIDQMLSISASHHNAHAAGQMSMFGGILTADTFGDLPQIQEIDNKTQLEWEKELMGVYFTPHPLLKLAATGKKLVGAYIGEISQENDGQQVTIGGIIKSMRQIVTKKGDAMAFLQLEDPQGTIEVVAFPRTFNDCRDVIHEDALVLVRGKVQVREEKIAVLADLIWNYPIETPKPEAVAQADRPIPGILSNTPVIVASPAPALHEYVERVAENWVPAAGDWEDENTDDASTEPEAAAPTPSAPASEPAVASTAAESVSDSSAPQATTQPIAAETAIEPDAARESTPSPIVEPSATLAPTNAETSALPTFTFAHAATVAVEEIEEEDVWFSRDDEGSEPAPQPVLTEKLVLVQETVFFAPAVEKPMNDTPPPSSPAPVPEIKLGSGVAIPSKNGGIAPRPQPSAPAPRGSVSNAARESTVSYMPQRGGGARRMRVRLQRTNDDALDTKRMREVVKLLRSAEGRDRFALVVPSQKSWVELDFPNYYTNIDQISSSLAAMVGDWGGYIELS